MSNLEFSGQQWEFVDADAETRSLEEAPGKTTEFPTQWRAFGALPPEMLKCRGYVYTSPLGHGVVPLVSADIESLTGIPEQLAVGDQMVAAIEMTLVDQTLDFGVLFGGPAERKNGYAMAELEVDKPTTVILGTAADYWMQWWIDGQQVLSTFADGNEYHPPRVEQHALRHTFAPGKHLLVVRAISGQGAWVVKADFVGAQAERFGTRKPDRWEIYDDGALMLPPKGLSQPGIAIRTDQAFVDETVECEFDFHSTEGQVGLVLGARDGGHYYWVYHPRWGQNWRARAFYLCIARVQGNNHVTNLASMLMPNVPMHFNQRKSLKVTRRGNQIQAFVNGVKGPMVIDDTYGAGYVGVKGWTDFDAIDFRVTGTAVEDPKWTPNVISRKTWFHLVEDTGYGTIREPATLFRFSSGEILAAISSRDGAMFGPKDPDMQTQLYLSGDAGRTWEPHGPTQADPTKSTPWGIRWSEPSPGVIRSFVHGPRVTAGGGGPLKPGEESEILSYIDSTDKGLTWSDSTPGTLVGDWSHIYRDDFATHVYGSTVLRNGTILAVFLRLPVPEADFKNKLGNKQINALADSAGEGTWGTGFAQPFCSRSDDGGRTWQPPMPMDDARAILDDRQPDSPHAGFSETVLGELPSGRIVVVCRPYRSPYSWQTHSDDGGVTWRQACYAPFSISGGPAMVGTTSGYLALLGREAGLTMHTSCDGGVNWTPGTIIDHDPWFNGWLIECEPDVVLAFYFSAARDIHRPAIPRMQRLRITPEGPVPLS
jgi:hypothetical protein